MADTNVEDGESIGDEKKKENEKSDDSEREEIFTTFTAGQDSKLQRAVC